MNSAEKRYFEISKKQIGKRFFSFICGHKIIYKIVSVIPEKNGITVLKKSFFDGEKISEKTEKKDLFFGVFCATKLQEF